MSARLPGVVFKGVSANRKLSPQRRVPYPHKHFKFRQVPVRPFCSSTYVSIERTCHDSCAFKGKGCYVQTDHFMSRAVARLDDEARDLPAFEVTLNEVEVIDSMFLRGRGSGGVPQDGARGGRDLRLHVGGDVRTKGGACLLGEAATRWRARGGGRVWTFTHSWRQIERAAWGPDISVLASVETVADALAARLRGYVPALVVDTFPGKRAFKAGRGLTVIPCPNETTGKTCVECRLCLDDGPLRDRKMGIAFSAHGGGEAEVKSTLVKLGRRRA